MNYCIKQLVILIIFTLYTSVAKDIPFYEKGAYIRVVNDNFARIRGELIAVENEKLYILVDNTIQKQIETVNFSEIRSFKLHYAKGKNLTLAVPLYFLSTLTHGWYLIFSAPINLITTILIANFSNNEYSMKKRHINNIEELKIFACFPQGIPETISLNDIK